MLGVDPGFNLFQKWMIFQLRKWIMKKVILSCHFLIMPML